MSDTTNGFLVGGEFTYAVLNVMLPEGATHQDAMDYARAQIESAGGAVVPREDSEIDRLRTRYDRLWDLFVDATGYEPSDAELGGVR